MLSPTVLDSNRVLNLGFVSKRPLPARERVGVRVGNASFTPRPASPLEGETYFETQPGGLIHSNLRVACNRSLTVAALKRRFRTCGFK